MPKVKLFCWPFLFLLVVAASACSGSLAPASTQIEPSPSAPTETKEIHNPQVTVTQTPQKPTAYPATETFTPTVTTAPEIEGPATNPDDSASDLLVVYTRENNLWLWKSDDTHTQLTDSFETFRPKISPDGKLVAFLQGLDIYNAELWVMHIDGSEKLPLISSNFLMNLPRDTEAVGTMLGDFEWVPGSHTLAYNTIQLFEIPSNPRNNDLRLVNAATGEKNLLLEPGQGGKFTYSPDGSQIALVTPESLSLVEADGSNRRDVLTFPVIYTNGGWNYYPQPVWAPDSSYLRVAIPPQDALNNPQAFTLVWHIPADGSMPYMASEFVSIPAYVSAPLISPDTRKIIFLFAPGEAFDQLDLQLLDLADGSQTNLYTGNISLYNWNPDSSQFVFTQDFGTDFYLGQKDSLAEAIADVSVTKDLAWLSVNRFIFTSGEYENRELRIGSPKMPSTVIAQPFGEIFSFDFYPKP